LEEELEAIAIAHVSLEEAVLREEGELKAIRERDLASFSNEPIPPGILEIEQAFLVKRNPLSQARFTTIEVEDEDEDDDDGYIPSSLLGSMHLGGDNSKGEEGEIDPDLCSLLPRSVATIDSFEGRNQDFLRF
jgi:hypothetical protein